ncbi:MAG: tetratricopeptide repeat protein [Saprospiraceae bacterium]|nr:tetratricopeptide repeat protein [Saprospiraceae bacterium]
MDFAKAIEIDPTDSKAYYYRGLPKDDLEDYGGAVLDFTKAIEIDPTDSKAYYNRGLAKDDLEDHREPF